MKQIASALAMRCWNCFCGVIQCLLGIGWTAEISVTHVEADPQSFDLMWLSPTPESRHVQRLN